MRSFKLTKTPMKTTFFTVALAAFQLVSNAQLIVDFEGANPLSVGPGVGAFGFTVTEPQSPLQSVGVFDSNGGLGLFDAHEVGIWNADTHALLATATVPAGTAGTLIDGAWYVNLATPLALPVGQSFIIGAFYKDSSFDFAFGNATSVTAGQGIEIGHAFLTSSSEFSFPDIEVSGADYGFFGATGRFAPVPEPAAMGVVAGLALLGFAALRRRFAAMAALAFASISVLAEPPVTIRAILDAPPAQRQRLFAKFTKQRPTAYSAVTPAVNRPPVTPGNEHGNRPVVPPGIKNYATP